MLQNNSINNTMCFFPSILPKKSKKKVMKWPAELAFIQTASLAGTSYRYYQSKLELKKTLLKLILLFLKETRIRFVIFRRWCSPKWYMVSRIRNTYQYLSPVVPSLLWQGLGRVPSYRRCRKVEKVARWSDNDIFLRVGVDFWKKKKDFWWGKNVSLKEKNKTKPPQLY